MNEKEDRQSFISEKGDDSIEKAAPREQSVNLSLSGKRSFGKESFFDRAEMIR